MSDPIPTEKLVSERAAARLVGLTARIFAQLHDSEAPDAPPCHVIGNRRRYRPSEVRSWFASTRKPDNGANPAPST